MRTEYNDFCNNGNSEDYNLVGNNNHHAIHVKLDAGVLIQLHYPLVISWIELAIKK